MPGVALPAEGADDDFSQLLLSPEEGHLLYPFDIEGGGGAIWYVLSIIAMKGSGVGVSFLFAALKMRRDARILNMGAVAT